MKSLTLEWIKKAEADFSDAHAEKLSVDLVCFLAQQCAEKYLKGHLQEHNVRFPKTHDLEQLLNLSLDLQPLWEAWRYSLASLSKFAAEFRYPGEWAEEQDAVTALRIATKFREEVRLVLGLPHA